MSILDWRLIAGPLLLSVTPAQGGEAIPLETTQSCGVPNTNTNIALEAEADFVASIRKSETVADVLNRMPDKLQPPMKGEGENISMLVWEFQSEGVAVAFIDDYAHDATVSTTTCGFTLNLRE